VVDHLRLYLNRPLRDGDRPRLFAIAVAVIAAGVAVLSLLDGAGPSQPRERSPHSHTVLRTIELSSPPTNPVATPQSAPSEEGQPNLAMSASPADAAGAKQAARGFRPGYLAYTYGRRSARHIPSAAPALEHELARQPPQVPGREHARHARVVVLQTDGVSHQAASVDALVDDGARRYTVTLQLSRAAGRWTVTGLGG
jgi:hypothetical protein